MLPWTATAGYRGRDSVSPLSQAAVELRLGQPVAVGYGWPSWMSVNRDCQVVNTRSGAPRSRASSSAHCRTPCGRRLIDLGNHPALVAGAGRSPDDGHGAMG